MSNERDSRGRFGTRNAAAKGRRTAPSLRAYENLFEAFDEAMAAHGETRTLSDFRVEALMRIVEASTRGDLECCKWLAELLREREQIFLTKRLPSPSKKPLAYLDALVRAVGRGELSTQQATRLGNLVKPLVADAQLLEMRRELDELRKRLGDTRGSGSAEVLPFS